MMLTDNSVARLAETVHWVGGGAMLLRYRKGRGHVVEVQEGAGTTDLLS